MKRLINIIILGGMGNLVGRERLAGWCPAAVLLEFLYEDPSDEVVRLMYGPHEVLQSRLGVRIPTYFAADLVELREILSLSKDDAEDDATFNLITAALFRMTKPERLIAVIMTAISAQLRVGELAFTAQLADLLELTLKAVKMMVHSCGGDPTNFATATTLMQRLFLCHSAIRKVLHLMKDEGDIKFAEPKIGGEDLEGTLTGLTTALVMQLVEANRFEVASNLAEFMLGVIGQFIVPVPKDCISMLHLSLARAMISLKDIETARLHFVAFIGGADDAVMTVLGLAAVDNVPNVEIAAIYCMQLPEVSSDNQSTIWLGRALLPLLPRCEETTIAELSLDDTNGGYLNARDKVYQMIIDANIAEEEYGEAHDFIIEVGDDRQRSQNIKQLCRLLVEAGKLDELFSFHWGRDDSIVESTLATMINESSVVDLSIYDNLYRWHLARGSLQSATTVMYQFAERTGDLASRYYALQMARNCLELLPEAESRWFALVSEGNTVQLHTLKDLKRNIVITRAKLQVGDFSSAAELVFKLLRDAHLGLAIKVVLAMDGEGWDLVASFLVDAHIDGERSEGIDRPWLDEIIKMGIFTESMLGESIELSILNRYLFLLNMDSSYFGLAEMFLRYLIAPPMWIIENCQRLDVNRLIKLLGTRQQLDTIVNILNDVKLRCSLTPGTLAYLDLLSQS